MIELRADLHIHTCLSPCGDLDMTPKRILKKAKEVGLDLIAITDHNACGNVEVAQSIGEELGIQVMAGMEVTSKEEVHLLGIFGEVQRAKELEEVLHKGLKIQNDPEIFGYQVLVNEKDEVEGFVSPLLISASHLSLEEVLRKVHELGGLCIAAHVDKPSYSIISQLGFIPKALELDAVEVWDISHYLTLLNQGYGLEGFTVVYGSDSHFLHQLGGRYTKIMVEDPSFYELSLALRNQEGRRAWVEGS